MTAADVGVDGRLEGRELNLVQRPLIGRRRSTDWRAFSWLFSAKCLTVAIEAFVLDALGFRPATSRLGQQRVFAERLEVPSGLRDPDDVDHGAGGER